MRGGVLSYMWETIGSIVLKYWVEFLLGAIVTGTTYFIKRYIKLSTLEREEKEKKYHSQLTEEIKAQNADIYKTLQEGQNQLSAKVQSMINESKAESRADDLALQEQINLVEEQMNCLKTGLLSVQGKEFKSQCRALLDSNHEITVDEWEEIETDHYAYNKLGGNHKGDQLFALVQEKAKNTFTK